MGKRLWIRIQVCVILGSMVLYLGGCKNSISKEIADTFIKGEYINTFYGKGTQVEYINGKAVQQVHFTEWKGKDDYYRMNLAIELQEDCYEAYAGKKTDAEIEKVEIQYLYGNDEVSIYYPDENKYIIKSMSLADAVQASLAQGINVLTVNNSAKEYTMAMISELNQKYDLTIEDDVKVNGRNTQHIKAIGKAKDTLGNKDEYWIDQKSWLIMKSYEQQGNYAIAFEYTDYQINPSIKDEVFEEDRQTNATVNFLGNNLDKVNKDIKFIEAPTYLEAPVYYLPDEEDIKLISTKYIERINEAKGIIRFTYHISGDREVLVENSPYYSISDQIDLGYEQVDIGGLKARYYEVENIKGYQIIGNGVISNIYVKNSEVSKEELLKLAKKAEVMTTARRTNIG